MWDGRESSATTTVLQDLAHQANDATRGHAQGAQDITAAQAAQIVAFETGLFTAQARDDRAGNLNAQGANGGPKAASFTDARSAIARGQKIFNTKPITISGVAGLNGQTFASGVTVPDSISGTCTVCHDSPNAGDHSVKAPLNIGLADPARAAYLPIYKLRNLATHETVLTTDPGRAMITGKWADVGKFKGPILRALAARAPYFHNGAAATLDEVVDFYETRFNIGLTPQEKADLVAFLRAL